MKLFVNQNDSCTTTNILQWKGNRTDHLIAVIAEIGLLNLLPCNRYSPYSLAPKFIKTAFKMGKTCCYREIHYPKCIQWLLKYPLEHAPETISTFKSLQDKI